MSSTNPNGLTSDARRRVVVGVASDAGRGQERPQEWACHGSWHSNRCIRDRMRSEQWATRGCRRLDGKGDECMARRWCRADWSCSLYIDHRRRHHISGNATTDASDPSIKLVKNDIRVCAQTGRTTSCTQMCRTWRTDCRVSTCSWAEAQRAAHWHDAVVARMGPPEIGWMMMMIHVAAEQD